MLAFFMLLLHEWLISPSDKFWKLWSEVSFKNTRITGFIKELLINYLHRDELLWSDFSFWCEFLFFLSKIEKELEQMTGLWGIWYMMRLPGALGKAGRRETSGILLRKERPTFQNGIKSKHWSFSLVNHTVCPLKMSRIILIHFSRKKRSFIFLFLPKDF